MGGKLSGLGLLRGPPGAPGPAGPAGAAGPVGEGGGEEPLSFHPVEVFPLAPISAVIPQDGAAGYAKGSQFMIRPGAAAIQVTGIRFYWVAAGSFTIRCKLWNVETTTAVATVDKVVSGLGAYEALFSSPYTVPVNRYMGRFTVSVWDTANSHYAYITASKNEIATGVPARPFHGGRRLTWIRFNLFKSGDAMPDLDDGNDWNMVEPVLYEVP